MENLGIQPEDDCPKHSVLIFRIISVFEVDHFHAKNIQAVFTQEFNPWEYDKSPKTIFSL